MPPKRCWRLAGFDVHWRRPLRRVIQKLVLDVLALKIVSGEVKEGDNVLVDAQDSGIVIKPLLKNAKPRKTVKTAA